MPARSPRAARLGQVIFLYRVRDAQGRVKTGQFEASSRQAALDRFLQQGWSIEELTQTSRPGSPPASPYGETPARPRSFPSSPARGTSRVGLRGPRPWGWLSLTLILAGCLWGLVSHRTPSRAPGLSEHRWELRIQGSLPSSAQRVRFSFPELPLQIDRTAQELSRPFDISLSLISRVEPTYCEVQLDGRTLPRIPCRQEAGRVQVNMPAL